MASERPVVILVTGLQGSGKSTVAGWAGGHLDAVVFGWDWAMAGLARCPDLQTVLEDMDRLAYRRVGWTLLWQLSTAELRRGRSVVLDGMARAEEVARTRQLARSHDAISMIVVARCDDLPAQRARIEGRRRDIPGWYELDWEHVSQARQHWEQPGDVDIELDTTDAIEETRSRLLVAIARQCR